VLATGSRWRADAVSRAVLAPVPTDPALPVLTPEALMRGERPAASSVLVYDDDHYYMGGVLAGMLAREGFDVTLATPAAEASVWMHNTMEQQRVQRELIERGVRVVPHRLLASVNAGYVELACAFTGRRTAVEIDALVMVSSRLPENALANGLQARAGEFAAAGILSVQSIGDALAPGTIAAAVFSGRRAAEELGQPADPAALPFRREVAQLLPLDVAAILEASRQ